MKKLILVALAFVSVHAFAQPSQGKSKKQRMYKMQNLTPEQSATLQTKKLTLHLDLSEKQQVEVKEILLANAKARKAKMEEFKAKKENGELKKPTPEQRYKMANAMLDYRIAMKAKMKKILNEEQYTKWEKAQARMAQRFKHKKSQGKKKMHQKRTE